MRKLMPIKYRNYLFFVLFIPLISCVAAPLEMRAYIDSNPKWKMIENCGYEHCLPMVDFLTMDGAMIRIEYSEDYNKQYFIVKLYVAELNQPLSFDPSKVKATFINDIELRPKVFKFGLDAKQMQSYPSLQKPILMKKIDGYHLFFDHPSAVVANGFTLDLNSALTLTGSSVDVPFVYFKKMGSGKR